MGNQSSATVWRWATAPLIAGMGLLGSAHANVIYDVVVDYDGGFRYTFSMEFALQPPAEDEFRSHFIDPALGFQSTNGFIQESGG